MIQFTIYNSYFYLLISHACRLIKLTYLERYIEILFGNRMTKQVLAQRVGEKENCH